MFKVTYATNLNTFTATVKADSLEQATRDAEKTVRGSNRAGRWMNLVSIEAAA